MARRLIFAVMAVALLSLACGAQMRGGFHGSARGARAFGGSFGGHHRDALAHGYFLGDTAFLYDDYPFGTAMPESAPSQLVLLQSPGTADVPTTRIASLLIELQGDHYVRYGGVARPAQPDAGASRISALETTSRPTMTPSQIAQQPLPPTMLIYRDGHREEVADYAIVGRVIYAHRRNLRNDGQTGYGLNQIQISALDVPATVKTNRDRGVTFVLPSGPNEVVTRP